MHANEYYWLMCLSGKQCRRKVNSFSLVEAVVVIVILAIIVAVAMPKLSKAAQNARDSQMKANQRVLQDAVERYEAEHQGPHIWSGGVEGHSTSSISIRKALTKKTNCSGVVEADDANLGPYLQTLPENSNHKRHASGIAVLIVVRMAGSGGVVGGSQELVSCQDWDQGCGWKLDKSTLEIFPCIDQACFGRQGKFRKEIFDKN